MKPKEHYAHLLGRDDSAARGQARENIRVREFERQELRENRRRRVQENLRRHPIAARLPLAIFAGVPLLIIALIAFGPKSVLYKTNQLLKNGVLEETAYVELLGAPRDIFTETPGRRTFYWDQPNGTTIAVRFLDDYGASKVWEIDLRR